ncbi:sensor histidine kinase [Pseudomonas fluorescens]|uniref:sensor histidine kinase n=1 Tax=Pseudomonas fluorescens TaxID=294 RepID=UPI0005C76AE5|nr:ATP-binding protein [Pseudomonas fluorescens]
MAERFARVALWSQERAEPFINQLGEYLQVCQSELPADGSKIIRLDGKVTRLTRRSEQGYTVIAASSDTDRLKSKKMMDLEVNVVVLAAPTIDASTKHAEQRSRRLIHNLKSLTAKTSQEIFYIVKQEMLLSSPRESIEYVSGEVRDNSQDTARAIIEILKNQLAQKAEFSAFEKLSGKVGSMKMESHDVHRVLMNVFYLFFGEFLAKKVKAYVEPTRLQAVFDYDSIHTCIYYLVENAVKYTMRNSVLNVITSEDGNGYIDIRFEMESLAIAPEEQGRVFDEAVSGKYAVNEKLSGAGIGLFLAREMARLNEGGLYLHAGRPMISDTYARNSFVLSLKSAG